MSQLRERYHTEVVPALRKEFQYDNVMQVPRLTKIVVNIGLGEALRDAKAVDAAVRDLTLITGQKPVVTRARKSIAQFRLRTGNAIGVTVTLRGERMWDYLERLTRIALPRIRDFRGVPSRSFDGPATTPWGCASNRLPGDRLRRIDRLRGLEMSIVTTATNDEESKRCCRSSACRSPTDEKERRMAKKSSSPRPSARRASRCGPITAAPCAVDRVGTCVGSRCAASASGSAPCWALPGVTKSSW